MSSRGVEPLDRKQGAAGARRQDRRPEAREQGRNRTEELDPRHGDPESRRQAPSSTEIRQGLEVGAHLAIDPRAAAQRARRSRRGVNHGARDAHSSRDVDANRHQARRHRRDRRHRRGDGDGFVLSLSARVQWRRARGRGATPGGERDAKGAQPAQATRSGDEDATVKVGTAAFKRWRAIRRGRRCGSGSARRPTTAFSAAMGVNYMLASEQAPDLRRGYGTVYGSLVWAAADEGVLPAAGLSKTPERDSARRPRLRPRCTLGLRRDAGDVPANRRRRPRGLGPIGRRGRAATNAAGTPRRHHRGRRVVLTARSARVSPPAARRSAPS